LGEAVTRTSDYSYDTNTGFPITETIEPKGDSSLKLLRVFARDNFGLVSSVQETSAWPQRNTWFWYDNLEHTWLYLIRNALGHESQYDYHPSFGVLVAFQDPNNTYMRWQVDGFGRVRTAMPPDGADVSISYGRDSTTGTTNSVKIRMAGGQEVETFTDRLGLESTRFVRGFDGRQISVDKSYDAAGRLVQISNPYFELPSGSTSFNYDALGRLRKATWPDGNVSERQYSGLVTSIFDENRNIRILTEDQLHRVISVTERADDGHDIATRFTYGPFGVLETITDPVGNKTIARFDTRGRRRHLVDPDSGLHTTNWNPLDELYSETNSAGDKLQYERDLLGRPYKIISNTGITTIVWDQAANGIGRITTATSGDAITGITTSFAYDPLARVSSQGISVDGGYFSFIYGYDEFGRISNIQYPRPAVFDPPFAISINYTEYVQSVP
jgi:YD repeat-containing protein